MARLLTAGAETLSAIGENKTMEGGITTTGAVTVDTATVHGGTKSFKCDAAAGDAAAYVQRTFTGVSATTYYARAWVNVAASPATLRAILTFYTSGGVFIGGIDMRTDGKLSGTWNFPGVPVSSVAVSDGSWHCVEVSLKIDTAAGSNDDAAFYLDGTLVDASTNISIGTTVPGMVRTGLNISGFGANFIGYVDDVALNDSTGSAQNTFAGLGKQVLLRPISDNAIGTGWTGGGGGTSGLFAGVDNIPPTGAADPGTDASQIRNATDAAANFLANLTTYATAGIGAADTINLVQPWVITGAPSATGAKTGALQLTSNPAEGAATAFQTTSNFFRASGVNAGTYPTGWAFSTNPITYAPSVTVGSSPVLTLDITGGTATRIAMCCFMGLYVDYTPAVATQVPYINPMPSLIAQ